MLRVGLTGGIGAGKSTVARRLEQLGAVVTDADAIAREVVAPGEPTLAAIRERFGPETVRDDGTMDRAAVASIVFADPQALADLDAITGPAIAARVLQRRGAVPAGAVDVVDMPLLVERRGWVDEHVAIVVDAPVETRVRRLVESRGMPEADARARIAAQATEGQRRAAADVWLDNSGSPDALVALVDELWRARLQPWNDNLLAGRAARPPVASGPGPFDVTWAGVGERALARLRHQLGLVGLGPQVGSVERLGDVERERDVGRAGSGDPLARVGASAAPLVALEVTMLGWDEIVRERFAAALTRAGFVAGQEHVDGVDLDRGAAGPQARWLGTDPAVACELRVRVDGGHAPLAGSTAT